MMGQPAGVRIWLAAGVTDLRKGFEGLSALVQASLGLNPYSGQIFVFRGRRGDRIKILWDTQDGLCLFYKRCSSGFSMSGSSLSSRTQSIRGSG